MNMALLIAGLIAVESGGNMSAVGDSGRAHGCLQIHPVMVQEANRIVGEERYTLEDRASRRRSVEIAVIYFDHYGRRRPPVMDRWEYFARIWNGGPHGHRKPATARYWRKVQAAIGGNR